MPHLTAVNHTRAEIAAIAQAHYARGIRNIMALRGDVPKGLPAAAAFKDGLRFGSDVVALLKGLHPDLCLGVGRLSRETPRGALARSRSRQPEAQGRRRGIVRHHPAVLRQRGLLPLRGSMPRWPGSACPSSRASCRCSRSNKSHASPNLCGASLPDRLIRRIEAAGDQPEIIEALGIDWALTQIRDLLARGAPGYHLYILNRARSALTLAAGLAA